jgi:RNA ligase (TIGR02306 family)
MAELKVEVVTIGEVKYHENADRLDVVKVFGYDVVTGRDEYLPGNCAVYFPVDSILPKELEDYIFAGTKMKLSKGRVRAAKIRGWVSQGLVVDIKRIKCFLHDDMDHRPYWKVGTDLTEALGVTKHDPEKNKPAQLRGEQKKKRDTNPNFKKYYQIQHLRKYDTAFKPGDDVFLTEKIHGTNFRCGWVPRYVTHWCDKLRMKLYEWGGVGSKLFGLSPYVFVYGSHNVELKEDGKDNVYRQCTIANEMWGACRLGEIWYGEIYGPGIQSGYGYGQEPGQFEVRFFDIYDHNKGQYLDFIDVATRCADERLKVVPFWSTEFDMPKILEFLNDPAMISQIDDDTEAEGLVVRSYSEEPFLGSGRKVLKLIADNYLLKKQSEFK